MVEQTLRLLCNMACFCHINVSRVLRYTLFCIATQLQKQTRSIKSSYCERCCSSTSGLSVMPSWQSQLLSHSLYFLAFCLSTHVSVSRRFLINWHKRGQRSGLPWPCVIFVPFTVHAWWNIFKTGTNIHLESLMIRIWVWADMHVLMDMLLASHSHILLLFVPILDFSFYMLLLFNSVYFCFLFHVVFIFWCCVHGQNMLLFSEYVSICSLTTYVVFVCTLLYYTNLHIDWSVV